MMEGSKNKELVMELLIRLKKMSRTYQLCDEEQRGRLLVACEGLIKQLVDAGYPRSFVETLLVSGKEFLDTLYSPEQALVCEASYEDVKIIFS